MTVLNLRGTNGSGKSSIAHRLLELPHKELTLAWNPANSKPVIGYQVQMPLGVTIVKVIVVGPYRTQCGGCDAIPTQDLVCAAVERAAELSPYVFFEGLLVSGIYQRYYQLAKTVRKRRRKFVWAILQTPLEECLRRVYARNGGKPIKEELVAMKLAGIESAERKARRDGETVVHIPWRRPYPSVLKYLLQR